MTNITSANRTRNSNCFGYGTCRAAIFALFSVAVSPSLCASDEAARKAPATFTGQAETKTAAEKQKASIAAMADSIARQRTSVQRQIGGGGGDGFFTLGPPQRLSEAARSAACPPLSNSDVNTLVGQAAKQEGLDAELLKTVMKQESAFQPCAVSPKGALGLMQLMPATASQLSVTNPFDPSSNVNAGAKLLRQLLDRYKGDVALALGAYNAGPANVDAAGGIPKIPETINYVDQILGALGDGNSSHQYPPGIRPYSFVAALDPLAD